MNHGKMQMLLKEEADGGIRRKRFSRKDKQGFQAKKKKTRRPQKNEFWDQ